MPVMHDEGVWIVLAACLVLFTQAGFAAREAGLARSKSAINVVTKLLVGALVVTLLSWALGFGLAGQGELFLSAETDAATLGRFCLYLALACVPGAIVSGAVAERLRLVPHLVVVAVISAGLFPLLGRWIAGGWLAGRGFVDAAGVARVHLFGGFVALAGVIAVGARAGRFDSNRRGSIPGSSLPFAVVGAFMLWLGFVGQNGAPVPGGATLARVLAATIVAGAAGGVVALAAGWLSRRRADIELPMLGLLAGVIAIGDAAPVVPTPVAVIIGAVGGLVAIGLERLLVRARLDDVVGAIPIHLGGGLWGTLAVGIFGAPLQLNSGLTRGAQIKAQIEGVLVIGILAFAGGLALFKLLGLVTRLRLTGDEESAGLNVIDHGAPGELADLMGVMEEQARTGDLTVRATVEPFTELGSIARQYNRVMETLAFTTAQTESLVRTSLDGLLTFNTDGIITSSNAAASAIFGYGEREFRSAVITSLFAPSRESEQGPRTRADLATLLKTFVGRSREVRGQRRSGEEFTMEASFNYVSVGLDEIYTATIRDITQRKETEAQLFSAQAEIRRRLEKELADAKAVQKALLPIESEFPGCEIARHYQSASETGGDWYGYNYDAERQAITFYMGDVTGHGLPSALLSGVVCGAVYSSEYTNELVWANGLTGERQLRNLADVVNRIVLQTGKGELLMTMAFLHVNLRTGQVAFLNAGHNMPLVAKHGADGASVANLVARGSRLGESATPQFEVVYAKLDPGDVVVLYTDGLIENRGPNGRVFSVREVKQVLQTHRSAVKVRDELVSRSQEVWGNQPRADDHSLLVFRWTPTAAAAAKIV